MIGRLPVKREMFAADKDGDWCNGYVNGEDIILRSYHSSNFNFYFYFETRKSDDKFYRTAYVVLYKRNNIYFKKSHQIAMV